MKNENFKLKIIGTALILLCVVILLRIILYYRTNSNKPTNINSKTYPAIPSPTSTPIPRQKARVTKVIDGDSIVLDTGEQVRYIGIDTPELSDKNGQPDCFSVEAKKANTALVLNQQVELEKDIQNTDKYGRLLRYAYVEDVLVNDFLVRWGFARVDTIRPNTKFAALFADAQKEAESQNRGLWSKCPK